MAEQNKLVGRIFKWHQRDYGFVRTDSGVTYMTHRRNFISGDYAKVSSPLSALIEDPSSASVLVRFTPVAVNEPNKCDRAVDVEVVA